MVYTPIQMWKIVTKVLNQCDRPQVALKVWTVLQAETSPGETTTDYRDGIAERAKVSPSDVSRAVTQLERIGALRREPPTTKQRGRGPIRVTMLQFW